MNTAERVEMFLREQLNSSGNAGTLKVPVVEKPSRITREERFLISIIKSLLNRSRFPIAASSDHSAECPYKIERPSR